MRLVTINGVTTVVGPRGYTGERGERGEQGLPGVNGRDAPSKDEILSALRNDKDLRDSIIENLEWDFEVERDDLGFLKNVRAKGKLKEEND